MDSTYHQVMNNYLTALGNGDYDSLMALFAEKATVKSPLYGNRPAAEFYRDLLRDTRTSVLTPHTFFAEAEKKSGALYFSYHWTMADGTQVSFDCVDVFAFDDSKKILSLHIIYDTQQTRSAWDAQPERSRH